MAINETGIPAHTGLFDAEMLTFTGRLGLTVMETGLPDAGLPDVHCAEEFKVQVMISPLEGVYEKTGLFVPALPPFSFHW